MTAPGWPVLNFAERFTKKKLVFILLFAWICFWLSLAIPPSLQAATSKNTTALDPDFPLYPSIRPNVDFWIDIFTKYSKSQGVIHDTKNLGIVYEIVRLDASGTVKANKKNKKIKKAAIKKYKNILLNLSKGKKPVSKEEKRVAVLFGVKAKQSDFKTAAFNLRCQTGLKKQFKDGLIRSGKVIDAFKKTFISHGLPVDLVYLPCVESSYDFKAYSKFGAAGIWQFTHGTGRQYMKINYVVDERRDPYISTDAAARLLKKNYAELKEWPMALTAYNHGLAGMIRAKKSKGSYENIVRSYHSRSFKFASRNFYSEFLAARRVAKNPEKYFGKLVYEKPVSFKVVKIKGYLPVNELAEKLNVPVEDIQSLNPALRKPVFNGQKYIPKGFKLKLPKYLTIPDINKSLASLYLNRQKPSLFHRVQKGDTAGSISRLHSVELNDLILANSLNRRATIYIGQNLRIPAKDEIILAQKESEKSKPKKKTVKIESDKKKPNKKEPDKKDSNKKTDKKNTVTRETAALSNKAVIVPEALAEPESAEPTESPAKPIKDEPFINPNIISGNLKVLTIGQKNTMGIITVEAEETLGHYADWLGIPTRQIRSLNEFKYGAPISINQKIKLPLKKNSIQHFEEQRYEFHKEIEEDFFESFLIQGFEVYEVKNGDSLWSLCLNELEIPVWLLKKSNPEMDFNPLLPGQKIKYPIIAKIKDD